MAKTKKQKPKKVKSAKKAKTIKKEPVDPNIEEVYYEEISFICPKRGLVKQKVKVKKYRTLLVETKNLLGHESDSDIIKTIENGDDGLGIYDDTEPTEGE